MGHSVGIYKYISVYLGVSNVQSWDDKIMYSKSSNCSSVKNAKFHLKLERNIKKIGQISGWNSECIELYEQLDCVKKKKKVLREKEAAITD